MSTIEKLLIVQDYDLRIKEWERELTDIPARKKQEEDRLRDHRESLEQAEAALKTCLAAIKDVELEESALQEKVTKLRQQQMQLKTNDEFKAMEKEISGVQAHILRLEDKELVLMERSEAARAIVQDKRQALGAESAAVAEDVKRFDERANGVEREIHGERQQRDKAAEEVDPEWLQRYTLLFDRKAPAVVKIENSVCGGCHMKLPPAVVNEAGKRQEMVFCDFCGRMLY